MKGGLMSAVLGPFHVGTSIFYVLFFSTASAAQLTKHSHLLDFALAV